MPTLSLAARRNAKHTSNRIRRHLPRQGQDPSPHDGLQKLVVANEDDRSGAIGVHMDLKNGPPRLLGVKALEAVLDLAQLLLQLLPSRKRVPGVVSPVGVLAADRVIPHHGQLGRADDESVLHGPVRHGCLHHGFD